MNGQIFVEKLLAWFKKSKRTFSWRETKDPYKIFIAEMMLQKTKANQAEKIFNLFVAKYPNFFSLSKAKEKDVREIMKPLGLFYRIRRILAVAKEVARKYNGVLPQEKNKLMKLHGVGNYIANAVLSFAFNKSVPVVDRNVARIMRRSFNLKTESEIFEFLIRILPEDKHKEFNWALLDIGGLVCLKREPKCNACPFNTLCNYRQKRETEKGKIPIEEI